VVPLRSVSGRTHGNGLLRHQLAMPSTPLKRRIFSLISVATNRAPFHPPADSPNIKRPSTVDCGMVDFLDRDRQSNLVLPSQFGQGNKPPRRPNFTQNMHPNKWCRRSLAHPNRTTPEYHDVDHGVAVGWPRRFCIIAHIAFVGGMGGWCCRTWCGYVCGCVEECCGNFLFRVENMTNWRT
jgi:hypothetical protein